MHDIFRKIAVGRLGGTLDGGVVLKPSGRFGWDAVCYGGWAIYAVNSAILHLWGGRGFAVSYF